ncbi:LysR family transcriptional regulator [Luoshenia tenuis]|jgi:DNA-binding transcriptional LysR family regulator|uniref:LysR family transcriptional regulator n=1 Tax=Luoshenia tenuis TaxID=2763654 RepID=UPI003D910C0D
MIDPKIRTFLMIVELRNYTQAGKVLAMSQPAVSHQMRQLEEEYNIKIFYPNRRPLMLTPEGEVLLKYARRAVSIANTARQALEDCKNSVKRFSVGITTTVSEYVISRVLADYCLEHPDVHINIVTDSIKNIYDKLQSYELDWAIIEGTVPKNSYHSVLLDTDYLCLVVSPQHPFAGRAQVSLDELKREKLILRSRAAGTRLLFDNYLYNHSDDIANYNIVIETDNITTIKELVAQNFGLSVMARSACRAELAAGRLREVPMENFRIVREINLIYREDFSHTDILGEIRQLYAQNQ